MSYPLVVHQQHHSPERLPLESDISSPPSLLARPRPIATQSAVSQNQLDPSSFGSQRSTMSGISDSLRPSPPLLTSGSATTTPFTIRTPIATASSSTSPYIANPSPASPLNDLVRVKSFPHTADLLGSANEASSSRREVTALPMNLVRHEDTLMQVDPEAALEARIAQSRVRADEAQYVTDHAPRSSLTQLLHTSGGDSIRGDIELPHAYQHPSVSDARRIHPWHPSHSIMPPAHVISEHADSTHPTPAPVHAINPSFSTEDNIRSSGLDDAPTFNELGPYRPWLESSTLHQHRVAEYDHMLSATGYAPSRSSLPSTVRPLDRRSAMPIPINAPHRAHSPIYNNSHPRSFIAAGPSSAPLDTSSLPPPATHLTQSTSPGTLESRIGNIEARVRQRTARGSPTPTDFFSSYDSHRPRPYDLPSPTNRSRAAPQVYNTDQGRRTVNSRSSARSTWLDGPSVPPPRVPTMFPFDPVGVRFTRTPSDTNGESVRAMLSWYGDDESVSPHEAEPTVPLSHPASTIHSGGRSRELQERLSMLDAIRTDAQRSPIGRDWPFPPMDLRRDRYSHRSNDNTASNEIMFISNVNGPGSASSGTAADVGEQRHSVARNVIRPSIRRWISFDEGSQHDPRGNHRDSESQGHTDGSIGAWNRDVHEAIGRRLSQARPDATMSRRLRDRPGQDWEDARVGGPSVEQRREPINPANRRTESPVLWGELTGDSDTDSSDALSVRDFLYPSGRASDLATLLASRSRHHLGSTLRDTAEWDMEDLSPANAFDPAALRRLEAADIMGDGIMDLREPGALYAYLNSLRRAAPPNANLKLTTGMSKEETAKVVQMVVRGVGRLPSGSRRKAADSVLETVAWGAFGPREDMQRDEYCSVCHDEYTEDIEVSVTPCKHMYHKGCLDTWLKTPNTSSCPMCRRDLAVLACLSKMVPSKTREDAIPLWMAA